MNLVGEEKTADEAAKAAEESERQKLFDLKVKDFKAEMDAIVLKYDVGVLVTSYFHTEGAVGVDSFGALTQIEQLGLATALKQRFSI